MKKANAVKEYSESAQYSKLKEYQAYLRFPLIKVAAESTTCERFNEICAKIEKNVSQLLDGLEMSFIPLLKTYPNLNNSCLKYILPLSVAISALYKVTQNYIGNVFSKSEKIVNISQDLVEKQRLYAYR